MCGPPSSSFHRLLGVYVNPREATRQPANCPSQFILDVQSLNASVTSRFVLPLLGSSRSGRSRRHALSVRHLGSFSIKGLHLFNFGPEPTCFPVVLGPAAPSLPCPRLSNWDELRSSPKGGRPACASFPLVGQVYSSGGSRPLIDGATGTSGGLELNEPAGGQRKDGVQATLQIQMVVSSKRQQGYPGMYPFLVYIHQSIEELKISCAPLVVNLDVRQLLAVAAGLLDSLQAVGSPLLLQLQTRPFETNSRYPESDVSSQCLWGRGGVATGLASCRQLPREPSTSTEEYRPVCRKHCNGLPLLEYSVPKPDNQERQSDSTLETTLSLRSRPNTTSGVLDTSTKGRGVTTEALSNLQSFSSFFQTCFASSSVATFGSFLTPPAPPALSSRSRCVVDSVSVAPVILSLSVVFDTLLHAAPVEQPSPRQHGGVTWSDEAGGIVCSASRLSSGHGRGTGGNASSDETDSRATSSNGGWQGAENSAFTGRLFSLLLRSLNIENAVVEIGSFSSDYVLLPLPVLQFFFSQHLQQQLKQVATTAVLSTDGLLNLGAWKGRAEAISALFLSGPRSARAATDSESRLRRKKSEHGRRRQANDELVPCKWKEGSLPEYLGEEADVALKQLFSTVDAVGAAGAIILEGNSGERWSLTC